MGYLLICSIYLFDCRLVELLLDLLEDLLLEVTELVLCGLETSLELFLEDAMGDLDHINVALDLLELLVEPLTEVFHGLDEVEFIEFAGKAVSDRVFSNNLSESIAEILSGADEFSPHFLELVQDFVSLGSSGSTGLGGKVTDGLAELGNPRSDSAGVDEISLGVESGLLFAIDDLVYDLLDLVAGKKIDFDELARSSVPSHWRVICVRATRETHLTLWT